MSSVRAEERHARAVAEREERHQADQRLRPLGYDAMADHEARLERLERLAEASSSDEASEQDQRVFAAAAAAYRMIHAAEARPSRSPLLQILQAARMRIRESPAGTLVPQALHELAAAAEAFDAEGDPHDSLTTVMRMKRSLLPRAAEAAREADLRQHAKVIARLQVGLPAVRGEALTDAQREAIAFAARLVGSREISREESARAGRLLRRAGLDLRSAASAVRETAARDA